MQLSLVCSSPSLFVHIHFYLTLPFGLFGACLLPLCSFLLINIHHLPASLCLSPYLPFRFFFPISPTPNLFAVLTYSAHSPRSHCATHWGGIVWILTWSAVFKWESPAAAWRAPHPSTPPTMIIVLWGLGWCSVLLLHCEEFRRLLSNVPTKKAGGWMLSKGCI